MSICKLKLLGRFFSCFRDVLEKTVLFPMASGIWLKPTCRSLKGYGPQKAVLGPLSTGQLSCWAFFCAQLVAGLLPLLSGVTLTLRGVVIQLVGFLGS